jgi:hypothetical protein
MKDVVLLELAKRWEHEAKVPEHPLDGSDEAKVPNALAEGERRAKQECAVELRRLIDLLGEKKTGE